MTPKSTVFAAAIAAAAFAIPAGIAQAAPIAPVQAVAGNASVTPVYYRQRHHGRVYRGPYRHHRRYGYNLANPLFYGAYAYQPEDGYQGSYQGNYQGNGYIPDASTCPYHGSNNLWWCH